VCKEVHDISVTLLSQRLDHFYTLYSLFKSEVNSHEIHQEFW